jgi:hypothetical protein
MGREDGSDLVGGDTDGVDPTAREGDSCRAISNVTTVRANCDDVPSPELRGLRRATDPAGYAEDHGLLYRDGRVPVTLELRGGSDSRFAIDVASPSRSGTRFEGDVWVDDLRRLARHDDVLQGRQTIPSTRPETDRKGGGQTNSSLTAVRNGSNANVSET